MQTFLIACIYVAGLALMDQAAHPAVLQGGMLVDPDGRTLYTYDNDAPERSSCNRVCQQVWLPLAAAPGAGAYGNFTIVAREDGTRQWAYRGKPLYRYLSDRNPGDMGSENLGGAWHTVRPASLDEFIAPNVAAAKLP